MTRCRACGEDAAALRRQSTRHFVMFLALAFLLGAHKLLDLWEPWR